MVVVVVVVVAAAAVVSRKHSTHRVQNNNKAVQNSAIICEKVFKNNTIHYHSSVLNIMAGWYLDFLQK